MTDTQRIEEIREQYREFDSLPPLEALKHHYASNWRDIRALLAALDAAIARAERAEEALHDLSENVPHTDSYAALQEHLGSTIPCYDPNNNGCVVDDDTNEKFCSGDGCFLVWLYKAGFKDCARATLRAFDGET
jgi:hypothetical protein